MTICLTESITRTAILYVAIIIVLRILGKRQIGEMQPNELVVTILISELAAIPMQDLSRPISNGLIPIFTLAILEILLSVIALKSKKARRAFNGKPVIIIQDGIIDQKKMNQMRLTIDDLTEDLRLAGIFNIKDVQFAVIETNGRLSVLQRANTFPVTVEQMNITVEEKALPSVIISDGKIQKENFTICGMNEKKLKNALNSRKLNAKDVFIMTADKNDEYVIIKKEEGK